MPGTGFESLLGSAVVFDQGVEFADLEPGRG
jgi:hypothetical protein